MYPCENFAKFALPTFRLLVAKDLIEKHGFTQTEAAKKLGITQAAISQYIHSKRGLRSTIHLDRERESIENAAEAIAKDISEGKRTTDEISESFCKLCLLLRDKDRITE